MKVTEGVRLMTYASIIIEDTRDYIAEIERDIMNYSYKRNVCVVKKNMSRNNKHIERFNESIHSFTKLINACIELKEVYMKTIDLFEKE